MAYTPDSPVDSDERSALITSSSSGRLVAHEQIPRIISPAASHSSNKAIETLKLVLPHVILIVTAISYALIGATIFMRMEQSNVQDNTKNGLEQLNKHQNLLLERIAIIKKSGGSLEDADKELAEYIEFVYQLKQSTNVGMQHIGIRNATGQLVPDWKMDSAAFFGLTTLTTIGYGTIVPVSTKGRVYCIFYAIIGVPLMLIATADLAKFLSSGITNGYIRFLSFKQRLFECFERKLVGRRYSVKRKTARYEEELEGDDDSFVEYLWAHLEQMHEVRIHAPVIFLIILGYSCLGGIIMTFVEPWTFFDSFYFSFISCMKIGFGDMVPENGIWLALLYSFFGLTVSTMCIDVVGVHYLERLHQFGRSMTTADYLRLMKDAKAKKRRKEVIERHYNTLMLLTNVDIPKIDESTSEKSLSSVEEEPESPPEPTAPSTPKDVKVVDLTPYTIKLAWTPPLSDTSDTTYILKYKVKHSQNEIVANISDVCNGEYEIKGLKSFSIYEISIGAENSIGRSDSVKLIQITEPETAPQKLGAEQLAPTSVRLSWTAPCKKAKDIQSYSIYYTTNADTSFEKWRKVLVSNSDYSLTLENLEEATQYAFCISSVYDKGHSPISKAVSVMTGFVEGSDRLSFLPTLTGMDNDQSSSTEISNIEEEDEPEGQNERPVIRGKVQKVKRTQVGYMTTNLTQRPTPPNEQRIFFVRSAERVDRIFPDWISKTFSNGIYAPIDLNQPIKIARRSNTFEPYELDPPISVFGQMMSQMLGRSFRFQKITLSRIYCSPALRCIQTASCVVFAYGSGRICIEPGLFEPVCWYDKTGLPDFMSAERLCQLGYPIDTGYRELVSVAALQESHSQGSYQCIANTIERLSRENGDVLVVGHAMSSDAGYRWLQGKSVQPIQTAQLFQLGIHYPYCSVVALGKQFPNGKWTPVDSLWPISYLDKSNEVDLTFANR